MRLKEAVHDGIDVFHLEGEIDLHFAPALRSLLRAKAAGRCPALILDLKGVSYIDSTGLSAMIEYFRDASRHGGVFCLCRLTGEVQDIFHMVKLDQSIPMFTTLEGAISAIRNRNVQAPAQALFQRAGE
jgi:anti-sigma B factor antagonist